MIYGIGVDSVQIDRIAKSIEKPAFLEKVYSIDEQNLLIDTIGGKRRAESAAANFAAKEAFLKAVHLGLGGFALHEIAALRAESGMPFYRFSGKALAFIEENNLTPHLSLTHESGLATAFCVLEKRQGPPGQL